MSKKIVLVHGLGAAHDRTWGKFPELLEKDVELDYEVIQYGYESPGFVTEIFNRAPSILNIAEGLITDLSHRCDLLNDEIILVGHSLGGLIIKKALLRLKSKQIAHNIRKVCFFDVPHDGSGYANAGRLIAFRNIHLKSLIRGSVELDELNDQWVEQNFNDAIEVLSVIAANDNIVSSSSSKSIYRSAQVETINDVDHATIVKPKSANSSSFLVLKRFILQKRTLSQFETNASRNLSDWVSVEDRNHTYQFVSDNRRDANLSALAEALSSLKSVVRITGASGLGKSRLIIEAISRSELMDDDVLVFNAPSYEKEIRESVRKIVESNTAGLIIVENCDVELHNGLRKETLKNDCALKLITVGYSNEPVDDSVHINVEPLSDDAINEMLAPILVNMPESDVTRVAKFAEGYPLLAVLMADQFKSEGSIIGSLNISSIVKKLIDGDSGVEDIERAVLVACCVFDVFGINIGKAKSEAVFIARDVAKSDLDTFDKVIRNFSKRQIVNRAGDYARVAPKPLALSLAAEWWSDTTIEFQAHILSRIPDTLLQSFCVQTAYLDDHPGVKKFSEEVFALTGFFGEAKVLLTEKGSRLFRALTEVNPQSTASAIEGILSSMSHGELSRISGDVRRNLIWGLEKLCFRAEVFEKSANSLLLLATAENEDWSNNATGQFTQLFRTFLSGTEAPPELRFLVIDSVLRSGSESQESLAIDALGAVIDTYGGSRTVGAEYQGSGKPLKEWRPKVWQEAFDYWAGAIERLVDMVLKEGEHSEKSKVILGRHIRGLVQKSRTVTLALDTAIRKIVQQQGSLWPAALESVKEAISYDGEKMPEEIKVLLQEWISLLTPTDLGERINIIVSIPPWEHEKDEKGEYVDVAYINAVSFAKELSTDIEQLKPFLEQLLTGEQRQAIAFARSLVEMSGKWEPLLSEATTIIKQAENANYGFVVGLMEGIHSISREHWEFELQKFENTPSLHKFYTSMTRTGCLTNVHLSKVNSLIESGDIDPVEATAFTYGRALNNLSPEDVVKFARRLQSVSMKAAWIALDILIMYCHGIRENWEACLDEFRELLMVLRLDEDVEKRHSEAHQWKEAAEKVLERGDSEFAKKLTHQILLSSKEGIGFSDLHHFVKPVMALLVRDYSDDIWPQVSEAIRDAEALEGYHLTQLFGKEDHGDNRQPSVLAGLSEEAIVKWCESDPDSAPLFIARATDVYIEEGDSYKLSPRAKLLLDVYGDNEGLLSELSANMGSFGWWGSVVPIYEKEVSALEPLKQHEKLSVRQWAYRRISYLKKAITEEQKKDEEHDWGIY